MRSPATAPLARPAAASCRRSAGLRALFFVLAALEKTVVYLNFALAAILAAVGIKMMLGCADVEISPAFMLAFMLFALVSSVVASLVSGHEPQPHRPARLKEATRNV